jgi:DNA-directed RNA polymerase subunit beta'
MQKLVEREIVFNIKKAKQYIEEEHSEVFMILEEVVSEHPVLLNRAPTLHRLGIQAFEPVLVEGKAIQLHPLVCRAFNADFDGDQMAVHVPLSVEAQTECWMLMLSSKNLLDPANGNPIVGPSQDMILGINYLTREQEGVFGTGKFFRNFNEILIAVNSNVIHLQALVKVKLTDEDISERQISDVKTFKGGTKYFETTVGRLIFNNALPNEIHYINESLNDKRVAKIIGEVHKNLGASITVKMLDAIKNTGFRYATVFGATIGLEDIIIPENKKEIVEKAQAEADSVYKEYRDGTISYEERYNKIQNIWTIAGNSIASSLMETLKKDKNGFNPIYMMADSGARGSQTQIKQLAGMRGLMAKPGGEIIELPIKSNFKEGLSVIEFYISTNGARKGLADTALKTADAGYLTRRLVDIAQDVVINEIDCGTINGIEQKAIKDGEEVIQRLRDKIIGRFTSEMIINPITGEIIIEANEEITEDIAEKIESLYIDSVKIRTVYTCESKRGVCVKCYGRNLATGKKVDIGESIGIIAAQSIGQPGTQLTMRTFHIGGAATSLVQENTLKFNYKIILDDIKGSTIELNDGILFARKGYIYVLRVMESFDIKDVSLNITNGDKIFSTKSLFIGKNGEEVVAKENGYAKIIDDALYIVRSPQEYEIVPGSTLYYKVGDCVEEKQVLVKFDPYITPIITEKSGKVKFLDLRKGITIREEIDETTSTEKYRVLESFPDAFQPRMVILSLEDNSEIASYILPSKSYLNVKDGEKVKAGDIIAKIVKKVSKAGDITGGLPRVAELFEARKPKESAVLAKVSGVVHFKGKFKGKDIIEVEDEFGNVFRHIIEQGIFLLVRDGDMVKAGDQISEGSINPHDVLQILGENKLQKFLMDEIQSVYGLQGVNINDKHIGVIVRQMMKKVEIVDVGDTKFIVGQFVDKWQFIDENKKAIKDGGQPAIAKPVLLGITRASLTIDSFFSAASFQETTKVLTTAAIKGTKDELRGLKENVIIGHLIPSGTGMKIYKNVKLYDENMEDLDVSVTKILEGKNEYAFENSENMK